MMPSQTRGSRIAYLGVFVALAMILSYVEVLIPFNFGIPGMKLGLANLVMILALYLLGVKEALLISIVRILLSAMLFGNVYSLAYSLAGGILSLLIMYLAKKIRKFDMIGVSILGGVFHNIGQILTAVVLVSEVAILSYLPVLLISGMVTGFLIGIVASRVVKKTGQIV